VTDTSAGVGDLGDRDVVEAPLEEQPQGGPQDQLGFPRASGNR
jgi:hypothetical protein